MVLRSIPLRRSWSIQLRRFSFCGCRVVSHAHKCEQRRWRLEQDQGRLASAMQKNRCEHQGAATLYKLNSAPLPSFFLEETPGAWRRLFRDVDCNRITPQRQISLPCHEVRSFKSHSESNRFRFPVTGGKLDSDCHYPFARFAGFEFDI